MMGKLLSIITLLTMIISPAMECRGEFCPSGNGHSKSVMSQQIDSQDLGSHGEQNSSKESGHCFAHCSHAPNLMFSKVTIQLSRFTVKSHEVMYSFFYENPTIDTIERPPLAS